MIVPIVAGLLAPFVCGVVSLHSASSRSVGLSTHTSQVSSPAELGIQPAPTMTSRGDRAQEKIVSLPVIADTKRLGELSVALDAGAVDEQIEAIKLLGRVGTPEQKTMILAHAKNPDATLAVRLAALENIDWSEHRDLVTELIKSAPMDQAILYMAADKELPGEVVTAVAQTAAALFQASADPSFQLAVLNFFTEHDVEGFEALIAQATTERYSESEIEDLNQLIATWNSERGLHDEMEGVH